MKRKSPRSGRADKHRAGSAGLGASFGAPGQWLRGLLPGRRAPAIAAGLILLATLVGGFYGLQQYVYGITRQRQVELTVVLKHPPRWASEQLIRDVCLSSGIRGDDFLLDDRLSARWANNLANNPWVRRVRCLRKRYDGCVELDCQLRQPIAVVKHGNQIYYIDVEGVVLPARPLKQPQGHLVQLRGMSLPLPQPGDCVARADLVAGLQVLALIRQVDDQLPAEQRLWSELAMLDVSNYEGRIDPAGPHLTLYTTGNTELRWGAAVGRSTPYHEAPAKHKVATLYRAHNQYGTLDRYRFVELRDLRKDRADALR